ncbi:MAG: PilN domain-containing protein [bacterium]|nr:PilN domain-containing protein [bacterium]
MVVKLDLRTNKQEQKTDSERSSRHYLLFSFAALFFISSLLLLAMGGYRLYSLRAARAALDESVIANNENLALMEKELARLTKESGAIEEKLDFILDDVPAIEFLYELEERMIDGVVVESLSMTRDRASLKGVAFADEEVLEFGDGLLKAASVNSVSLPVITSAQRSGMNFKAFSIEVKLNPLQNILLAGKIAGQEAEAASADAQEEAAGK